MRQINLLKPCFGRLKALNLLFLATGFLTLSPPKLMANPVQKTTFSSKCLSQEYSQNHSIDKIYASEELYNRGLSLDEKGDLKGALDCIEQAVLLAPDYWVERIREQIRSQLDLNKGQDNYKKGIDRLTRGKIYGDDSAQTYLTAARESFDKAGLPACVEHIKKLLSSPKPNNFQQKQECLPRRRLAPKKP